MALRRRLMGRGLGSTSSVALAILFVGWGVATAATTTVTSTADTTVDDGVCTLREAILAANTNAASGAMPGECAAGQASPTVDTIAFDIPGAGLNTITPGSNLPTITEVVIVDGGNGGVPANRVELSGAGVQNSGLLVSGASDVEIRNLVINGFTSRQILVIFTTNSVIQGNILGLDAAGTAIVAGSGVGIDLILSGGSHVIGGATAAARNVISSEGTNAISIDSSSATVRGNLIGLNAAGTATVGAPGTGIAVSNASATIGGTGAGEGNVIVAFTGIRFGGNPALGHSSGTVQGNFIGTDVTGTVALNLGHGSGIDVDHATGVVINGGNVISGNGDGVTMHSSGISGATSDSTTVQGNFIGTAADGVTALGNSRKGVDIFITNNNVIGGVNSNEANVIAFNGEAGLRHGGGTSNPFLRNSIFSNGKLGIDLVGGTEDPNGVTPNDPNDDDTGANNLQNSPVITAADVAAGNATISGTLDSTASTTFRVELFANAACDPSGDGEGQTFIGSTNVTTDGSGDAGFGPLEFAVPDGQSVITSTATDPNDNTSEFSACLVPPPELSIDDVSANEGNSGTTAFTFTVTMSAASASTVTVNYATADGTAAAPSDYSSTSDTLTFNPGITMQQITVSVNGDTTVEPNEAFTVNLSAPINATIATGTGTGTIVNDDAAPQIPTLSVSALLALALLLLAIETMQPKKRRR